MLAILRGLGMVGAIDTLDLVPQELDPPSYIYMPIIDNKPFEPLEMTGREPYDPTSKVARFQFRSVDTIKPWNHRVAIYDLVGIQ